jgi:hypothetical protein
MAEIHQIMFHNRKPYNQATWSMEHDRSNPYITQTRILRSQREDNAKKIFIPIQKNMYNRHQTFDIKRTSGRYHSDQIKEQVTTLPMDAIPADFYEFPESIFFKFALPSPPFVHPIKYDLRRRSS